MNEQLCGALFFDTNGMHFGIHNSKVKKEIKKNILDQFHSLLVSNFIIFIL